MRTVVATLLSVYALCLVSCHSKLDKNEYIRWVTSYENGLHVNKTVAGYIFDVQYKPDDFFHATSGAALITNSDSLQYYVLKVSREDGRDLIQSQSPDEAAKQQLRYYYAYRFQQDIFLEEGNAKYPCEFFHFEQNDLLAERTFILGFPAQQGDIDDAKLLIQSNQFSSLPIRIKISKQNIPALKL